MKEKILIINKSRTINEYLRQKLSMYDFEVIFARDGFDGQIKMKNEHPDLIILDYYLTRISLIDFLKDKRANRNNVDIPVILIYSKTDLLDKDTIINLGKYKVTKIVQKPIDIDILFKTIGELLNINFVLDSFPCMIDAHINGDILFIDISKGLNKEKIDLAKYRIHEIRDLYKVDIKKILFIFSDIQKQQSINEMLDYLLSNILSSTNALVSGVHILTKSRIIREYILSHPKYRFIEVSDDLNESLKHFGMIDKNEYEDKVKSKMQDLLSSPVIHKEHELSLNLNYSIEKKKVVKNGQYEIAVIDDDLRVLEYMEAILVNEDWDVYLFDNGRSFIESLKEKKFDILIMDLVMPDIDGFKLLEYLNKKKIDTPIIIYTGLKDKQKIVEAMRHGVVSYMVKPVKPEIIISKISETFNKTNKFIQTMNLDIFDKNDESFNFLS